MIFLKKILFLFLLLCFSTFSADAIVNTNSAHIVMEATTNRILEGHDVHKQYLIASTAKILTAITAIEHYDIEQEIVVTKEDTLEVGSKVYLKENEVLKRKDLLYALMLRSANDAASALSQHNSSLFIQQMNETAKKIGMKNSVFVNASGLDEREYNLSTAYDMALLSAYASKNSIFKEIASSHDYSCKTKESNYVWHNKHKLVTSKNEFIWGKTGYTKKSKRILVSNYELKEKNLLIVTINDGNDWNHHQQMANNTESYHFINVFKKGVYNTKQDVDYYLHIPSDITVPVKKSEKENVKLIFKLYKNYARLEIYLNNLLIMNQRVEVYSKENFDIDLVIDLFQ